MSVAWNPTVEDGIHAWVVASSGLAAANVIWEGQNGPRPDTPYISLNGRTRRIGQDWLDVVDAAVPAPGAEIEHRGRGMRELFLDLQCFSDSATGATSAHALLEAVIAGAILPTPREALKAAGVGLMSIGPVRQVGAGLNPAIFEPRAMVEIRGSLVSEVIELGTYIETVSGTNQINGETYTVPKP